MSAANALFYGWTNSTITNCSMVDKLVQSYYIPVMYSSIFAVGLLGNVFALLVYVFKVRPWKSCTIIMFNLVLTDLIFLTSLPFLAYYYASNDTWTLGIVMCRFIRFIYYFNLYGSILFLTSLAIFRYVVILHPLQAHKVKRKRWGVITCLLVWAVAVAGISPIFNLFDLVNLDNKTYCLDFASNRTDFVWPYSWVLTVLGYLVPLVIVSVCYWRIMNELKKGPHMGSQKRVRARRVIVLVLTCFVVCYLPFHVLRALRIHTRLNSNNNCMLDRGVNAAYIISRPIAVLNIIFNLALYTLTGDGFKNAFTDLIKCKRLIKNMIHDGRRMIDVAVIHTHQPSMIEQENS